MRVVVTIGGGLAALPGLSQPIACDADSLAEADRDRLLDLVAAARRPGAAAGAPAGHAEERRTPGPRRGADRRSYVVVIEEVGASRRFVLEDPLPPEVARLVAFVRQKGERHGR